ncbi:MAG: 3-oxoacyl-ACP reductase FabG [Bdellovibrionales bacterium]|nr:3-oxoacyl-ACP reductase FabG [Bdellovibrionales bacterium]
MSGTLNGKRILITGGSRGIGAEIVRECARRGARVAFTATSDSPALDEVLKSLEGQGHLKIVMNVNDEASVTQGMKTVLEAFGGLDGLVSNAGITKDQLILMMKPEEFDQVIQTNLRGSFLTSKAALKPLMKAKGGSIVFVTSVIGQTGNGGQANYAASKAGIQAYSKSLAQEMGSRGIRSNCIAPGFIQTDMTASLNEAQKQAILNQVPLGTLGEPKDVAYAVCFLLSDESKYITGHTLSINGGMHME